MTAATNSLLRPNCMPYCQSTFFPSEEYLKGWLEEVNSCPHCLSYNPLNEGLAKRLWRVISPAIPVVKWLTISIGSMALLHTCCEDDFEQSLSAPLAYLVSTVGRKALQITLLTTSIVSSVYTIHLSGGEFEHEYEQSLNNA